jgi:putative transposase
LESLEHHESYLGKRIKRGLFKSSKGRLINADINGAIGILRKVKEISEKQLNALGNRGCVLQPIKLRF